MNSWYAVLLTLRDGRFYEIRQPEETRVSKPSAWRDVLVRAASRLWGGCEGRDWQIVRDNSLLRCYAVQTATGEVLEVR